MIFYLSLHYLFIQGHHPYSRPRETQQPQSSTLPDIVVDGSMARITVAGDAANTSSSDGMCPLNSHFIVQSKPHGQTGP